MNATDEPIIVEQDFEELVRLNHTEEELGRIREFLSRFCKTGRLYLARLFVRGRIKKKSVEEILAVCETIWEQTWRHGTPDRIGDVDDVAAGGIGLYNTSGFYLAYHNLGLIRPKFLF